jgi:hypothetical protein
MAQAKPVNPRRRSLLAELDWVRVAVVAALFMLGYLALAHHLRLGPGPGLAVDLSRLNATLAGWFLFLVYTGLVLTRRPWSLFLAVLIAAAWLALQLRDWYLPALLGPGLA